MAKRPTYEELESKIKFLEEKVIELQKSKGIENEKGEDKEFKESLALFRKCFSYIPSSINLSSISDGRFVEVNEEFLKLTGYSRDEVIGKTSEELGIVVDKGIRKNIMHELQQDQQVPDFEIEITRKSGEKIIALSSLSIIVFQGKKFILNNAWDITDQKKIELALKESEEKFRIIFENSLSAMLVADDVGNYLHANDAATKLFGYSIDEFLKMKVGDLITSSSPDAALRYQEYLSKGQEIGEFEFFTKDGIKKISQYQAIRIKPNFNFSLNMDITHQKTIEQNLKHYVTQLNQLNADKDRFISILAHDLKNPFNSILGYLSLLTSNIRVYDLEKIERQVALINSSAQHLHNLLDDLLHWAIAKSSTQPYTSRRVHLADICNTTLESFRLQADLKNIKMGRVHQNDAYAYADVHMLKTVLRNLISNAIKFTPAEGSVDITFEPDDSNIIISVIDTGLGISPEKQRNLFNPAVLSSSKGTSGEIGTGFGLLLCKELVKKQGGNVWVESELGKGSCFKFTLPLLQATT